jgi:hypothetical protein
LRSVLFVLLVFTFAFSFYKKLFIFITLIALAGALEYITNKRQVKFNLGHVFFLAMLLASIDGKSGAVLFVLFAGFLPQVLVGNLDIKNMIGYPLQMFMIFLASFIINQNFMLVGIIISCLTYGMLFFIAKSVGEPLPERITEVVLPLIMNIIYFISLGQPLVSIIGRVIQ